VSSIFDRPVPPLVESLLELHHAKLRAMAHIAQYMVLIQNRNVYFLALWWRVRILHFNLVTIGVHGIDHGSTQFTVTLLGCSFSFILRCISIFLLFEGTWFTSSTTSAWHPVLEKAF